jgi:hypothetical protein
MIPPESPALVEVGGVFVRVAHDEDCDGWIAETPVQTVTIHGRHRAAPRYSRCEDVTHHAVSPRAPAAADPKAEPWWAR